MNISFHKPLYDADDETTPNQALQFFPARSIGATFHYFPLHLSPGGRSLGFAATDCPATISASERLLRLPIFPALTPEEKESVVAAMMEFAAS